MFSNPWTALLVVLVVVIGVITLYTIAQTTKGGASVTVVEGYTSPKEINGVDLDTARQKGGTRRNKDTRALEEATDEYFRNAKGVNDIEKIPEVQDQKTADRNMDIGNGKETIEYKHPTQAKVENDSTAAVRDSVAKGKYQGATTVVVDARNTGMTAEQAEAGLQGVTARDLGDTTRRVIVLVDGPDGTVIEVEKTYHHLDESSGSSGGGGTIKACQLNIINDAARKGLIEGHHSSTINDAASRGLL